MSSPIGLPPRAAPALPTVAALPATPATSTGSEAAPRRRDAATSMEGMPASRQSRLGTMAQRMTLSPQNQDRALKAVSLGAHAVEIGATAVAAMPPAKAFAAPVAIAAALVGGGADVARAHCKGEDLNPALAKAGLRVVATAGSALTMPGVGSGAAAAGGAAVVGAEAVTKTVVAKVAGAAVAKAALEGAISTPGLAQTVFSDPAAQPLKELIGHHLDQAMAPGKPSATSAA